MNEPRYPEDFLPLAEAARASLESLVTELGDRKDPGDLLFFIHPAGDAPAYHPDLSRTTDTVVVGVGTRALFLKNPRCERTHHEHLVTPPPVGAVQALVHLRHEGELHVAPMQIELRAAGAFAGKVAS